MTGHFQQSFMKVVTTVALSTLFEKIHVEHLHRVLLFVESAQTSKILLYYETKSHIIKYEVW